jgi:hypothetical protein
MHVLGHDDIPEQVKPQIIAGLRQLFYEDVPGAQGLQKRQPAVAAEGDEVQMALTVVALQTSRHGEPQEGNNNPKTQVPTPNLGHPPPTASRYSADI